MKILKTEISDRKEMKEFAGLVKGEFLYEVKSVNCAPVWTGPRIAPEAWAQVLAFFKWTYDTMKSESQVRGYVNAKEAKWGFWAFPQKAKTGMTATETGAEESLEEAKERCAHWGSEPSDDWIYAATIHHHCSCSAFQSGTDENNEKHQFGLHITVGNMDKQRHDLHCRFTLNKCQFEPDMDHFWDIGAARALLPVRFHSECAAYQMGIPTTQEFPDKWKENVIEEKVTSVWTPASGGSYYGGYAGSGGTYGKSLPERAEMAMDRIAQSFASRKLPNDPNTMRDFFELWGDEAGMAAWRILRDLQVDPEDICRHALNQYEIAWDLETQAMMEEENAPKQIKDKGKSKKELEKDKQKEIKQLRQQQGNGSVHDMSDEAMMRRAYGCE